MQWSGRVLGTKELVPQNCPNPGGLGKVDLVVRVAVKMAMPSDRVLGNQECGSQNPQPGLRKVDVVERNGV